MSQSLGVISLVAVLTVGCSFETYGVDSYVVDRGLDLTDVIDFKGGVGVGLGAKIQATDYLGAGLGAGSYDSAVESFGRRFYHAEDDGFLQGVVYGADGTAIGTITDDTTVNIALIQLRGLPLPLLERFRIGGELLLPGIELGLYINLGEILDLICGVATFDPALDDGMGKGTDLFPKPLPEEPDDSLLFPLPDDPPTKGTREEGQ